MSRNYKCHNPEGVYFVSFAVVEWLDVFTRGEYKDIVITSVRLIKTPFTLVNMQILKVLISFRPQVTGFKKKLVP